MDPPDVIKLLVGLCVVFSLAAYFTPVGELRFLWILLVIATGLPAVMSIIFELARPKGDK